jgi:DNA-binding CsgD family transcriptional regulator
MHSDRLLAVDRTRASPQLGAKGDDLGLTRREREILAWVARGKTNSEIAQSLWIAPSTVRKHLENIYPKLGVRTRTGAVMRVLGVIDD